MTMPGTKALLYTTPLMEPSLSEPDELSQGQGYNNSFVMCWVCTLTHSLELVVFLGCGRSLSPGRADLDWGQRDPLGNLLHPPANKVKQNTVFPEL